MAVLAQGAHSATISHPRTGLGRLISVYLTWRAERRDYVQTMRDLHRMESRDLQDLGITPYDFDAIAHSAFKR